MIRAPPCSTTTQNSNSISQPITRSKQKTRIMCSSFPLIQKEMKLSQWVNLLSPGPISTQIQTSASETHSSGNPLAVIVLPFAKSKQAITHLLSLFVCFPCLRLFLSVFISSVWPPLTGRWDTMQRFWCVEPSLFSPGPISTADQWLAAHWYYFRMVKHWVLSVSYILISFLRVYISTSPRTHCKTFHFVRWSQKWFCTVIHTRVLHNCACNLRFNGEMIPITQHFNAYQGRFQIHQYFSPLAPWGIAFISLFELDSTSSVAPASRLFMRSIESSWKASQLTANGVCKRTGQGDKHDRRKTREMSSWPEDGTIVVGICI